MSSNGECLKAISQYIQKWIEKQANVKEESITDWLLLETEEKIANFKNITFSRHEEGEVTGADWEWWLIFPHHSYKFRVQAKKIIPTKPVYKALNFKEGKQIEKLINDAKRNNAIPLYALYTNSISRSRCRNDIKDEGVYLAGAFEIKEQIIDTQYKKVTSNELFEKSIPLSCILCCPWVPKNIRNFLESYFLANTKENTKYNDGTSIGEHEELPLYIKKMIHQKGISLKSIQQQFSNEIEGIRAITIIDFSQKYN